MNPLRFPIDDNPFDDWRSSARETRFKTSKRQRPREKQPSSRRHRHGNRNGVSWIVALAALALAAAGSLRRNHCSLVVLASGVGEENRRHSSNDENDASSQTESRKPFRTTYGGRIKLIPNRKIIRITNAEEWETCPWNKSDRMEAATLSSSATKSSSYILKDNTPPADLWTMLAPYLKRGLLLIAMTAVAIVDRSPPPSSSSMAMLSSTATASRGGKYLAISSWTVSSRTLTNPFTNLRLDWNKLRGLPGEVLPSLSAALMIAWIPNLVFQRAWWELGFLALSLTSQANLRNYMVNEILPSLGGTMRKLVWGEFWKQAWDYLLEPFPHNILVPNTKSSSEQIGVESWSQWQLEFSQFWSDRVVSRIDKWTASSVKALLQKNVQSSVNGLAADSWNAMAYAWYPDGNKALEPSKRIPLPRISNEDTARVIEIECENDDNCDEDDVPTTKLSVDNDNREKIVEETDATGSISHDNNELQNREESTEPSSWSTESEVEDLSSGEEQAQPIAN